MVVNNPIAVKNGVHKASHGIPLIAKVVILEESGFQKAEYDTLQIY